MYLSSLIKEASFCNRWKLLQRSATGQNAENKRLWNAQLQWIYLKQRFRENCGKSDKKQNKTTTNKNPKSQRLRIPADRLCSVGMLDKKNILINFPQYTFLDKTRKTILVDGRISSYKEHSKCSHS